MIQLHLSIYDGEASQINFESKDELCDYLKELKKFNCIWLATADGENGEIIVTENVDNLVKFVEKGLFEIKDKFFVQEYQSYEAAYSIALSMKESNPKCYEQEEEDSDMFPIIYKGQKYFKKDCHKVFLVFYTCKDALNPDGGVYMIEGDWIYPDGTIEEY